MYSLKPKMYSLILASDAKNGIGKMGSIPWTNKVDMANFRQLTHDNIVVMGRKTWESLDCKPLKNRRNIVISSSNKIDEAEVCPDLYQLHYMRQMDKSKRKWYIIGGSGLYNYFLQRSYCYIDEIYWTTLHDNFDCDTTIQYTPFDFPHRNTFIPIKSTRWATLNDKMKDATFHHLRHMDH